jgi:hypothetical protein
MKYHFTVSTRTTEKGLYDKSVDLLLLPHVPTEDAIWFFYALKKDYLDWNLIMFPEIHAIFSSELLSAKLANQDWKKSTLFDVSDLDVNRSSGMKGKDFLIFCNLSMF